MNAVQSLQGNPFLKFPNGISYVRSHDHTLFKYTGVSSDTIPNCLILSKEEIQNLLKMPAEQEQAILKMPADEMHQSLKRN